MKPETLLARKLRTLQTRISLLELLADFLRKNPAIVTRCQLKTLWNTTGLLFEEALIRPVKPVKSTRILLRLERYSEDEIPGIEERTVCEDVSKLSPEGLAKVLKKVGVDLSKPDDDYEDDEVED